MMGERVMMRELRLCDKGVPGGGGWCVVLLERYLGIVTVPGPLRGLGIPC